MKYIPVSRKDIVSSELVARGKCKSIEDIDLYFGRLNLLKFRKRSSFRKTEYWKNCDRDGKLLQV